MRTRFRLIVVGLLVLVVVVGAGIVARSMWQQNRVELALEVIELLPDVAQRIQNFHRVKIDGDRKVWEVSAKEARYLEDAGVVEVREPVVAIFMEEGHTVAMRGRRGKVYLEARELDRVEVEGDIDVQFDEYSLSTDFARYEAESEHIVVPGVVRMEGPQVELDGEVMEIDLAEERVRVRRNVRMLLWPKD